MVHPSLSTSTEWIVLICLLIVAYNVTVSHLYCLDYWHILMGYVEKLRFSGSKVKFEESVKFTLSVSINE